MPLCIFILTHISANHFLLHFLLFHPISFHLIINYFSIFTTLLTLLPLLFFLFLPLYRCRKHFLSPAHLLFGALAVWSIPFPVAYVPQFLRRINRMDDALLDAVRTCFLLRSDVAVLSPMQGTGYFWRFTQPAGTPVLGTGNTRLPVCAIHRQRRPLRRCRIRRQDTYTCLFTISHRPDALPLRTDCAAAVAMQQPSAVAYDKQQHTDRTPFRADQQQNIECIFHCFCGLPHPLIRF